MCGESKRATLFALTAAAKVPLGQALDLQALQLLSG